MRLAPGLRRALLTSALLAVLGFLAVLVVKKDPGALLTKRRADFRCFYWWSRAYRAGLGPHEGPALAERETGEPTFIYSKYPPSVLLWAMPLTVLDEYPAQLVFFAGLGVCIVLYMALCGYLSGYPTLGTAAAYAWSAPALQHALNLGQPTPLGCLVLATALLLLLRGRWLPSGVMMGLLCTIKPLEIAAYMPLALARDWRAALAAGGAFVGAVVVLLPVQGSELWVEFFVGLPAAAAERTAYFPRHYLMISTVLLALGARALQGIPVDQEPSEASPPASSSGGSSRASSSSE